MCDTGSVRNVMFGKKLINIWLAFRILGLGMNFDNTVCVTCILCWHSTKFYICSLDINLVFGLHALTTGRLYLQNSLVIAHSFRPTYAVAKQSL